jgi:indole-3-glycerol phosphate synthase
MDSLMEVNNEDGIRLALNFGVRLVRINNQNLHDFAVTRLAALIPEGNDVVLCALSGISTRADVERCSRDRVDAGLVGVAFDESRKSHRVHR